MKLRTLIGCSVIGSLALTAVHAQSQSASGMPHLEKRGAVTQLIVDSKAAVEEEFIPGRMLYFDNYDILVRFRPPVRSSGQPLTASGPPAPSGRVLVGQLGAEEFLIAGFDAALEFKPALGSEFTGVQGLLIEEGVYENGVWKPTYLRNGNIADGGLVLRSQGTLIKAKLMRY